jgi:hypothetical protein
MNDLNAVVATFNVGLGGFYATSVDNNGKMSMTQVQGKNINKISSHQKAFIIC